MWLEEWHCCACLEVRTPSGSAKGRKEFAPNLTHRRIVEALHIHRTSKTTNLDYSLTLDSIWFPFLTWHSQLNLLVTQYYALLYSSPPLPSPSRSSLKCCTTDEDLRIETSCIEWFPLLWSAPISACSSTLIRSSERLQYILRCHLHLRELTHCPLLSRGPSGACGWLR